MGWRTHLLLFLTGLYLPSPCLPYQYHFVESWTTWKEAQTYCRDTYTDLVTIRNIEDMNRLMKMDRFSVNYWIGTVWIGLYDDIINSWGWSLEDSDYYGKGEAEFRHWQSGAPDNVAEQPCVVIKNGMWKNQDCKLERSFICCTGERNNSPRFILVNETKKSWGEAQNYCRNHYRDLASVRNQAENQEIETLVGDSDVWIGLFSDSWKWSDGSGSSFRHWKLGEPNNNDSKPRCGGAVFKEGNTVSDEWTDWPCDNTWQPFVCYSTPPVKTTQKVVRVRLTPNDQNMDMNDPVIQEAILLQIKKELREKGMSDDVKLRWKEQPDGKIFHK
ncbi:C-type mannose receptor 2-like [Oncorhynchus tshawytscha]|uniref:C-type lectin domain-containing protein n=1 Tax=Oncorhynchus tshawytscha TaxID=74940 RepID=A0A8C8JI86_ONCTS|nr:C-type mannose receptor 2-like [Oncorhynchus tshawytscha]